MANNRIVGQCNAADFIAVEHLIDAVIDPKDLDTSTLKHKKQLAILFANVSYRKGIKWKLLREVVKEAIFWGDSTKIRVIEVRFIHDSKKIDKVMEFKKLWHY